MLGDSVNFGIFSDGFFFHSDNKLGEKSVQILLLGLVRKGARNRVVRNIRGKSKLN